MRIIAGTYRGRAIEAPKGMGTRPTTDRVRESLMSAIASATGGFEDLVVLDAFAGSGALGIESLSRGADTVIFADKDPKVCSLITKNLKTLGVAPENYRVYIKNTLQAPPQFVRPYDLVFLDPPYIFAPDSLVAMLEQLEAAGCLAQDVLITYEHAKGAEVAAFEASEALPFEAVQEKTYGDTTIHFYRRKL